MSSTQDTQQMQDRQVAVSDDDFTIMDITDPEKGPESGGEEAGAQPEKCKRRWGRCHRRKLMRRQMESEDECQLRSHHLERRMMRKMAKRWMMRMMWRRMMFRMCYGGPMGMGPGYGCRNRRRMRMMAAMIDTTDTSSSESGDRQEHGAGCRRRRSCRGKKFGRHFEEGKRTEDVTSKNVKKHGADVPLANTEGNLENAGSASCSKDAGKTQTTVAENTANLAESGGIRDGKCRRKEQKKGKCMRKVHFCDMTSGDSSSDSSSSSSESSQDENVDVQQETEKTKEHRCRRGWRHRKHMDLEGKEDETGEAVTEERKAWKGKKFHRKMMKRMSRMRLYGRRYY